MNAEDFAACVAAADAKYFHCPAPNLCSKAKPGKTVTVHFPVSISYNGGTVIDDKWYAGYIVPAPIIPEGYELISIAIGLELNCHPPQATRLLRQIKPRK